ncbi:MarR family transcriptional regulator [Pseudarthrobacter sp. J75]|uniref:MarR family transcriptional regulator n=1 Tax=unclassified Pseudarthrobacter TaxID=2647000 RepID=UPI002E814B19|nr:MULTISPECIES: MarR family transcriptional regulator [unclassified Pseudarthrobacter]MEE2521787.1 MarR family transcriptional regulator [Pseudarthrobacter sp. J47]MEE2527864.1 MarR family transcriptional regulator [Pseudarthrobacter sp. J75]
MYVLTIDQRGSTRDRDRVPELLAELTSLGFPSFERSVGDELQGVVDHAGQAVDAALHALRSGHWYVGIGLGEAVVPDGGSPREGIGSAFVAARHAVEFAKGAGSRVPLSVVAGILAAGAVEEDGMATERPDANGQGTDPAAEAVAACADAQAVLRLIARLRQERTAPQWKLVDTLNELTAAAPHGIQKLAAERLGVSEQSVSRTLIRAGWQEELAARPAAARLLEFAHRSVAAAHGAAGAKGGAN